MNLSIAVSPETEAWLERRARAQGLDEAATAAAILEQVAKQEPPATSPTDPSAVPYEEWVRNFEAWLAKVPARPGPPVDASRESIYE